MTNVDMDQDKKRRERDCITKMLRTWYGTFKNIRLYTPSHPSTIEAAGQFVSAMAEWFKLRFDFLLKQSDGLFMVEETLLIEESLSLYELLRSMEKKGVVQILFLPGLTPEETIELCLFLQDGKATGNLSNQHIRTSGAKEQEDHKISKARQLFDRSLAAYENATSLTEKIITKLTDEQTVSFSEVSQLLDVLIDLVGQRPMDFALIISTRPAANLPDQQTLDTLLMTIFIGLQLGLDLTSLKILAVSALLHDVGRQFLPTDFGPKHRLQPGDTDFIQLHARDGATFLTGVQDLPMSVIRVALEHHIGNDGMGYPALPDGQSPHIFSQIVGLADFVSWATVSENHYHRPTAIHRLVRAVLHRSGTQFSPLLVKLLLPFFGMYPPGTMVELNTGECGIVMTPNLNHIFRPLVLVKTPQGTWSPRNTAGVSDAAGPAFNVSIVRTLGHRNSIDELIDFLPDIDPNVL